MKKPVLSYQKKLPIQNELTTIGHAPAAVIFYDQKLTKFTFFKQWLRQFSLKIPLKAGESLKTLSSYEDCLTKLQKIPISKQTVFVAVGGGSIGDFVGFLASTYQRGKPLVHIPSTWLSAVDSAHGGKNGLNFLKAKNQIGTFYSAQKIFLCQELLFSQPHVNMQDAFGEVIKIAFINRPALLNDLEIATDFIWKNLKTLVDAKYEIVKKDPYEAKGIRQLLNLGHTMGHVFESAHGLSHGQSILLGLLFSLRWSHQKKYLSTVDFYKLCGLIFAVPLQLHYAKALHLPDAKIKTLLAKDKKATSAQNLRFVFLRRAGKTFIQNVPFKELLSEIQRQRKEL